MGSNQGPCSLDTGNTIHINNEFFGKDTYLKNMKMYYKRIKDYFWPLKEKK